MFFVTSLLVLGSQNEVRGQSDTFNCRYDGDGLASSDDAAVTSGDCAGFTQSGTDDFNWEFNRGSTPSSGTGPTSDADGSLTSKKTTFQTVTI